MILVARAKDIAAGFLRLGYERGEGRSKESPLHGDSEEVLQPQLSDVVADVLVVHEVAVRIGRFVVTDAFRDIRLGGSRTSCVSSRFSSLATVQTNDGVQSERGRTYNRHSLQIVTDEPRVLPSLRRGTAHAQGRDALAFLGFFLRH